MKNVSTILLTVISLFLVGDMYGQLSNVSLTQGGSPVTEVVLGSEIDFSFNANTNSDAPSYRVTITQSGPTAAKPDGNVKIGSLLKPLIDADETDILVTGTLETLINTKEDGSGTAAAVGAGFINFIFVGKNAEDKWEEIETVSMPVTWKHVSTNLPSSVSLAYKLYPNPASSVLNIEAPLGSEISVYNLTGVQVLSVVQKSIVNTMSLSGISSGVYFVKIVNEGTTVTEKIRVL